MHARTLILLLALAALASAACAQERLVLKRTARIEPDTPLRLGDIATLTGPKAEELAELVLLETPSAEPTGTHGWFRIEIDRVLDRLTEALGESAGMVALSGSACDVRILTPAAMRTTPTPKPTKATPTPDARNLVARETVRGAVARELVRILQTPPQSLRLGFDEEDREFLDTPTTPATGRVVEVVPGGASVHMPVTIALYDPSGRMTRKTIRVKAEVHRPVAVVSRVLARGRVIEAADISAEVRWLPPSDRIVTPEAALGSVTRRRLDPGQAVDIHAIEPPVMVHKGDMVHVRVVTPGLIVRREGNALRDGCEGEVIEFAARHNPKERFRATIVGRGAAVVWIGNTPGTPLAKTSPQPE